MKKKIISMVLSMAVLMSFISFPVKAEVKDPITVDKVEALAETLDVGNLGSDYSGDIDIYTTFGSLPTLYALLELYTDLDEKTKNGEQPTPSYVWYQRGGTADPESLPDNVTMMRPVSTSQSYTDEDMLTFMAYVNKLYKEYPKAHFNLYCDDLRIQYELTLFSFNNVPENQYSVYLLSDGTGSYSYYASYMKSNGEEEEAIKKNWDTYKYWYNTYKSGAKNGKLDDRFYGYTAMGAVWMMWYACSEAENPGVDVQYYLQWPEILKEDLGNMEEYFSLKKLRMQKVLPNDLYKNLSPNMQNDFMNAILSGAGIGMTMEEYDKKYFPDGENGKYIIISGTSPNREGNSPVNFERIVENIQEDYGDEYTYMYKPHPNWPAAAVDNNGYDFNRVKFLKDHNITELPAQTPMECLIWSHPYVKIGGYNSSLYMSATEGQVEFFMTDEATSLDSPLPGIFKLGFYDGARFYPTSATNTVTSSVRYRTRTTNADGTVNVTAALNNAVNGDKAYFAVYNSDESMSYLLEGKVENSKVTFSNLKEEDILNSNIYVWNDKMKPAVQTLSGLYF